MLNNLIEFHTQKVLQISYMQLAIKCWKVGDENTSWLMLFEWIEHKNKADKIFKDDEDIIKKILVAEGQHKTGIL